MKNCSRCKELKELSEFGYRPQGKLKRQSCCNTCYREIRLEKSKDPEYRKRDSIATCEWVKRHGYKHTKEQAKKYTETKKSKYPEKYIARSLANVRNKKPGIHRHHWSYNIGHAKDIIELTKEDHIKIHKYIIYDQSVFMYRRYDTLELLDTKEKHIKFIDIAKKLI